MRNPGLWSTTSLLKDHRPVYARRGRLYVNRDIEAEMAGRSMRSAGRVKSLIGRWIETEGAA